ncbi:MAG TPA: CDP-alcohol phosphatidyltransferase family protein [Actinomycetes bacterium]|jgi:CDP-diacylglycerol---glycerol-3-phosphate 3-phosphatidyltransferase|nr:CDP-alcohol phosphatidyltransferase family protein [Actinomycetes bacterium]
MLTRYARAATRRILTPLARGLLRIGVGPDLVTFIGTLGVCVGALAFYPRGSFFPGSVVITLFVLLDTVDGTMARLTGRRSSWGAFLDSTLDRVADGAIFGGLALWYAGRGDDLILCAVAIYCLVSGAVVPYAKARAESLGMTADVGIAERADRLTLILVCTGLSGLGVPYLREAGLWLLAVAATVTVVQRMVVVRRQAMAQEAAP